MVERDWDEYWAQFAGEEWREEFMPEIEGVIIDQGEKLNFEFGMAFDIRSLFAEKWFDEYTLVFAQDIMDTTKRDISEMLQQAMANGWSIPQMSKQLGMQFDQYIEGNQVDCSAENLSDTDRWFCERSPRYRREMVARTETIRASNAGSQQIYTAWGAEYKEWLATADNRTRGSHLAAWRDYSEGGTPGPIPIDQPFHVGGSELMYPGDPAGEPGEAIQCRCTTIVYFKEFASTQEEIDRAQAEIEALIGAEQTV